MKKLQRLSLSVVVGLAAAVWASTAGALPPAGAPEDMVIQPDSVSVVRDLPGGPPPFVPREIQRHLPDPDALNATKQVFGGARGQLPPGPETLATPTSGTVGTSSGIDGLSFSQSGGFVPPDTQVGVSSSHIFEAVNLEGRILTRSSGVVTSFQLASLFGLSSSTNISDPKIRFDPISGRWFVVLISYNTSFTQGAWRLAVSQTGDPTGAFTVYVASTSKSAPDFPGLAVNDDKVVLTANAFRGNSYIGTEFIVINKANVVAGTSASATYFGPPQGLFTIRPAHPLSSCGGSPCPLYMAAVAFNSATAIEVWLVQGVPGVSAVTVATTTLPISSLTSPPNAVQMGTTTLIETNDNRLLDATLRGGTLWVSANSACAPDATTRACMRFIQLSVSTSTVTKVQDFDFGSPGTYFYYPAIQTDSVGNLIAVFSASSAQNFAGVWASGQGNSDGPNTFRSPVVIQPGLAPYKPFANRWGDYSGAALDPSNTKVVWGAGEYVRIDGGSDWGTNISAIQMQ